MIKYVRSYFYYFLIFLFVILLYGKAIFFSFVSDDWFNIFDNAKVYSLSDLKEIFLSSQLNFGAAPYYRPFDTLYFLITYRIFGDNPFYHHLLSLILFVIFSWLLFLFYKKFSKDKILALFFSLLFISHPALVEVVCWISARNQIIEGIIFISMMLCLEAYRNNSSFLYISIIIILGYFAIFFHDIGLAVIPLVFLYSLFFLKGKDRYKLVFTFIIALAPAVMVRNMVVSTEFLKSPLKNHLFTFFNLFRAYLNNIFFPLKLKIHYYDLQIKSVLDRDVAFSFFIWAVFVLLALFFSRKERKILYGFLWFFITLIPASGLLNFIPKSLISDRYLFLPLIGLFLSMLLIVERIQIKKKYFYCLCLIVAAIFSLINTKLSNSWKNDLVYSLRKVKEYPDNAAERNNLAAEYIKRGELKLAETEILEAMRLSKKPVDVLYITFAYIEYLKGDATRAEGIYLEYLKHDHNNYRVLYNLGTLYLEQGRTDLAKINLEKAIKIAPSDSFDYAEISNNLAIIYLAEGDKLKARSLFEQALKIKPYEERYIKNLRATY